MQLTVHWADWPFSNVAVMVAVPALTAVTVPVLSTVATLLLLLLQVTFLLVALSGCTVAVRVSVPPTVRDRLVLSRVTPVTGTDLMVSVYPLLSLPALLVAVTVKVEVPAVVGVPVILPSSLRRNPAGRVPLVTLHVMVGSPVASSF